MITVKRISALASVIALLLNAQTAYSADKVAPSPIPGVEFTKIQDLNPNAKPTNNPIKQKWAVVIGASKFKEKRLDNSGSEVAMDKSAQQFYDYLIDPHGGRFQPDHVKLLINSGATRQNIVSALTSPWLGSLAGPDDLVVVYIATNGFPTTDGSTYLCAYDCAIDNVYSTCISMQTLMDTLRKDVKSQRIMLVLQSCYSGAAELTSGAKALTGTFSGYNIDIDKVALGKGYIILSSSRPDQMTWSDAFSRNLIKALRQQDGLIPLKDAFEMAKKQTEVDTSIIGPTKKQTPVMKSDWTGNELVLGTPPIEKVSELPDAVKSFLSAEAYYLKGTNKLTAGDLDGAAQEYEAAIAVDPKYADALGDFGALKSIKGDWQSAANLYKRAIAVRPNDSLFHANYARVLEKLGQTDASRKELEQSYSLNPKDRVVLQALASKCLQEGDPIRAVKLLQEAVTLFPTSESLHSRLSYAYVQNGDIANALTQAKEAVSIAPDSPAAKLNLGSSLLMSGDKKQAIEVYKQAIALAPTNADAHYLLSNTLESAGDKQSAIGELNKFLELCQPNDARIAKARAHLQELGAGGE
ncbi:MAG: tetratricopeptide repeat protein [Candidatus Obscuribacterales bacterium]